ncbi:hypothetical protein EMMF5_005488 [Cystobasidiomycetes sp. EMM_F5]
MYIPFVSISRRAGGGGGRGGGGSSSGSGARGGSTGSTGSSSGGSTKGSTSSTKPPPYSPGAPPPPYTVGGGTSARGSTSSTGGGRQYTVAAGQPFAGAVAGGGTRSQVYGSRGYGSVGYYPYYPTYPYYYGSSIYGPANNSSRPGGELQSYTLIPSSAVNGTASNGMAGPSNNTFFIYSDANSVQDMVGILQATCSLAAVYGRNLTATPFNAVQFYRGDSFSLHLQDYNNTLPDIEVTDPSTNFTEPDTLPSPLPSNVNSTLLNCLNTTIGSYVGLIDSDYASDNAAWRTTPAAGTSFMASAALLVALCHMLF